MMKQNSNRRSRSRSPHKRTHGKNSYDSNGPAGKVRGTAQQVLEKYQLLGRDALSSGDWIAAETCLQYAEHYYRIVNAELEINGKNQESNNQNSLDQASSSINKVSTQIPIIDTSIDKTGKVASSKSDEGEKTGGLLGGLDVENAPSQLEDENEHDEGEVNKIPRRRRSRAKVEN